jgi:hypothetical protein
MKMGASKPILGDRQTIQNIDFFNSIRTKGALRQLAYVTVSRKTTPNLTFERSKKPTGSTRNSRLLGNCLLQPMHQDHNRC